LKQLPPKLPDAKFFVQTAIKGLPPRSVVGPKEEKGKRPRRESNPDLKIRSLLFCPLNYEGSGRNYNLKTANPLDV
jgi:hypothetical protein